MNEGYKARRAEKHEAQQAAKKAAQDFENSLLPVTAGENSVIAQSQSKPYSLGWVSLKTQKVNVPNKGWSGNAIEHEDALVDDAVIDAERKRKANETVINNLEVAEQMADTQ